MASFLLIGDSEKCTAYINEYITKESLKDFQVETYNDKILIEHSRQIVHSLSLANSSAKLIILRSQITIEAQNALLKNIEELPQNFTFMICATSQNEVLPTISSRCFVINLGNEDIKKDQGIHSSVSAFIKGEIDVWSLIEKMESSNVFENDTMKLLEQLRFLMLDPTFPEKHKIYNFCKKLLHFMPLIQNNNINKRIALEKVFL